MKKITHIILCVLLFAICSSAFSICCFAEDSKPSVDVGAFPSNLIDESKIDVSSLIREKATKERIDKLYNLSSSKLGLPKSYRLDPDVYVLEYFVSQPFWNGVKEMNYKGLTETWSNVSAYPTIYVPLFGEIADSQGEPHNRVIGHVKLSYDWIDKEYGCSPVLYGFSASNYKDGQPRSFEALFNYFTQSKIVAEQVFLIRHSNSFSDFMETVAVIKTENDTVILDISDSLHLTSSMDDPAVAYSIEEYRTRRLEVEKELYKTVDSWEDVPFGGSGSSNPNASQNNVGKWVPYVIFGILAVGGVAFAWVQVRKKSQHP